MIGTEIGQELEEYVEVQRVIYTDYYIAPAGVVYMRLFETKLKGAIQDSEDDSAEFQDEYGADSDGTMHTESVARTSEE